MLKDRVWILASLDRQPQGIAGGNWTLVISPTSYSLPTTFDDYLIEWCSRQLNCSSYGNHRGTRYAGSVCDRMANDTVDDTSMEVERVDLFMAVSVINDLVSCSSLTTANSSCSTSSKLSDLVARELLPSTNATHEINRFSEVIEGLCVLPWAFDIRMGWIASEVENGVGGDGTLIGRFKENGLPSGERMVVKDDLIIWPMGGKTPVSRCSVACPPSHTRYPILGQPACCFVCLYCEGSLNYTNDGSMRCEQCAGRHWFNPASGTCEPRYLDYLRWDSIPSMIYIIISIISAIVNLILLGVIAYHHKSPIVKAANYELSLLLLIATTVALVAPMLHIGLPTPEHCMLHVGIQGPLISLIVSVYLVKTKGVLSIFEAKLPDLMRRHLFLERHLQLLAVFIIVMIEAVAVTLYLVFLPPGVLYIDSSIPHITYVECDYGAVALPVQWLYNWVIVIVAFVLAFKARHLPENFGESRLIAGSMGCSLIIWVLSFTSFVLSNGSMKAIFQNAVLVICPWIFMGFLYFPKCYIILRQPHRNTVQELRRMTLAHVQRKAEQVCDSSLSRRSMDIEKQKPIGASNQGKQKSMKMSPARRVSGMTDERIILQIDAPYASEQGTDETAISSSGSSVSSTPHNDERDSVLSTNDYSVPSPPLEFENKIYMNGDAKALVGNTNNSNCNNVTHKDAIDNSERVKVDDEDAVRSKKPGDQNESSTRHLNTTVGEPDWPIDPALGDESQTKGI